MKKAAKWLIIGILAGAVAGWVITSLLDAPLKKENAQLKDQIAAVKVDLEILEKTLTAEREALLEQIGGLQGNIDSLMTVNVGLENDLLASQQSTADLEAHAAALQEEVQPVLDANPKVRELVLNLMAQVAGGKDQVLILAKQKENLEEALVNSENKYLAQVKMTDTYKVQLEREAALRQLVETRLSLQDKRVGVLERRQKLTIGGAGLAVGAAVLTAILSK